jgi:hypothetical protein
MAAPGPLVLPTGHAVQPTAPGWLYVLASHAGRHTHTHTPPPPPPPPKPPAPINGVHAWRWRGWVGGWVGGWGGHVPVQGSKVVWPDALKKPPAQVHTELPGAAPLPAGQAVQLLATSNENVLASQSTGVRGPASLSSVSARDGTASSPPPPPAKARTDARGACGRVGASDAGGAGQGGARSRQRKARVAEAGGCGDIAGATSGARQARRTARLAKGIGGASFITHLAMSALQTRAAPTSDQRGGGAPPQKRDGPLVPPDA